MSRKQGGIHNVPEMKRIGVADVVMSQTSERSAMKRLGVIFVGEGAEISLDCGSSSTEAFSTTLTSLLVASSSAMVVRRGRRKRRASEDGPEGRMHGYLIQLMKLWRASQRGGSLADH